MRLTPLTTFVIRGEALQDRFTYATNRDADSVAVMPGFELKPQALISGQAYVGVRRFNALRDDVPDYTGLVAGVSTKFSARSTLFEVRVARDLAFSYEVLQPYYAQTDVGLQVTQRITSKWDIVGRGARQQLAYKNLITTTTLPERVDHSWQLGGGIGYRMAETLRLGVDANYYRRDAPQATTRNYEGLRVGASFSYGLTQ
jgi:hypothetical protein